MCLILLSYQQHPNYRIVLAANRDEFYNRPTERLHEWPDQPGILAGRDLEHQGTWMGITRTGRLAAITNYRNPAAIKPSSPSRGQLVAGYLESTLPPGEYLKGVATDGYRYNGFNLMMGNQQHLFYYSNQSGKPEELSPGLYGLSNHLMNTPWPKVAQGRKAMARALTTDDHILDPEIFIELLEDQTHPPESRLPDTGVGLEMEKMLSPMFITSPFYGTRSSSVLLIDVHGMVTFVERTWKPAQPAPTAEKTQKFVFIIS